MSGMGRTSTYHLEDTIKYTSCGYHCLRQCILKVRIRNGVIMACEPDDTIPSTPREDAYLPAEAIDNGITSPRPCAKGYAQAQMIYDPKRLRYPVKRVGMRSEGKFQRISWDEALDTIAGKLSETKKNYGPFSIIHNPYTYFGRCSFPLAPWFGAGIAAWAAHSTNGWEEPQRWVLGKEIAQSSLSQDENQIFNSRLIVLWGLNPLSTLSGGWAYKLIRAKERGIPIICIESRYTQSAEVLADQWIPIRPTTDVAMMIAVANVWFKEDLCDKEFIKKWVEPEGLRKWQAYVLGIEDGIDKTPEWAEAICGVPGETIEEFARLYARSKPVNLNVSLSMGRQFYGENPTRAAMYLQALTGNTFISGGTPPSAQTALGPGRPALPRPTVDWQRKPATYNSPVLMAAFKWPKAIDLREKLNKGEISKELYNNSIGNLADNPAPNIQVVILEGNNHLNSLPDINCTIRAMKKVDFVLVFSQYAELPTARYADIILPQIYTPFEGRNCWQFNTRDLFRGGVYGANYIMYLQKCVEPVGEVKSHDWVWTQVARRLGIAEQYNPRMANVADDEWDKVVEDLHQVAYEKWAAREEIAPLHPANWAGFQRKPVFWYEVKDPYYPFKEELQKGENPLRGTASGKIEFYSDILARGPEYLATHDCPPGSGKCYGGGELPPMAQMTMGGKDTFYSKDVQRYPLLMSSPHSLYRVHSSLDNNLWLRGDCYRHAVWLNIADAKARGIKDDDLVKVYNDIGEMIIPAYVTSRVIPGTVFIFHGAWYQPGKNKSPLMPDGIDRGGAANVLVHNDDLTTTIVGMFPCKGLVQVEKGAGV